MIRLKKVVRILVYAALFSLISVPTIAQKAEEEFGKNRLQFQTFNWRYYSTENFEIYFYDGGNELTRIGAQYLEKEFDRITDVLGYSSYYKTKIFLYNSVVDMQQSNVGIDKAGLEAGGQTNFIKTQVEIAFPGTMEDYKTTLTYKVAEMLINDMMFGGSLSDMFQSSYLLSLPDWFISGAAAYVAEGWSVEMDDYVRELLKDKSIKKLHKYDGKDAEVIGQSIWNFIGERYGSSYISNILNLTRIVRNEEKSISGTIGVPFKRFLTEWNDYYQRQADFVYENYKMVEEESIVEDGKDRYKFNKVKISPEKGYVAYTKNVRGRYRVYVKKIGSKKEKVVQRGGYKVLSQEVDYGMPLISWRDENTLGIILNKFGRLWMHIVNVNTGSKVKKQLYRINQVRDFDIAKNGNVAVLSAERNGMSDLYLVSLRRNSIKRITNDLYDDVNPKFIPGTSSIVFSSNRDNDTIYHTEKTIKDIKDVYNVFIYNIDTTKNIVHRVTNTLSQNLDPVAPNDQEIYYISDQQGIFNLYKYNLRNNIYHQVTNYSSSINSFDIADDKSFFVFTMRDGEETNIYYREQIDLDKNIFTTQTKRQQYLNAKMVAERFTKRKGELGSVGEGEGDTLERVESLNLMEIHAPIDTSDLLVDTDNFEFEKVEAKDTEEDEKYEDTDSYVFDTDVVSSSDDDKGESFLSKYRKLKRSSDMIGPLDYQTRFTADNVVTSFVIDPLIGLGINIETEMNDLLENYKFKGGVLASTDLKSGNIYGEFEYLKHTVDFKLRYDRNSLFWPRSGQPSQKYILNKFELTASLPINVATRISLKPFYAFTKYYELDPRGYIFPGPNGPLTSTQNYAGGKAEVVFDNTIVTGLNQMQGTRGKIGYVHWEGLNDPLQSFSNVFADLRHYQKIHRELVFASRLFYGRYLGPDQPSYLLGGMDNWLFFNENDDGETNPLAEKPLQDNSELLFLDYVTSLRGFNYNTFHGSNVLLFNAELRFPVITYFYRGHIASNFFRNLQFIGFYDIGSAWTGNSPFAKVNNINTEVIEGGPFKATIQNFRNPWLQSYGFGVRTVLLGYYVKFDLAYPIEDNVRKNPRVHVTLGYDF